MKRLLSADSALRLHAFPLFRDLRTGIVHLVVAVLVVKVPVQFSGVRRLRLVNIDARMIITGFYREALLQ